MCRTVMDENRGAEIRSDLATEHCSKAKHNYRTALVQNCLVGGKDINRQEDHTHNHSGSITQLC